jgi:hypothetical protein
MADLRYFRVLPRIGESVEHLDGAISRRGRRSYRVLDIWHNAWNPEDAEDLNELPTIILDDPAHPELDEPQPLRLHPDDIDLLAERIAEHLR